MINRFPTFPRTRDVARLTGKGYEDIADDVHNLTTVASESTRGSR